MYPKRKRWECVGYQRDPEFVPFPVEEIEQTIPDRFRKQVDRYADRLAVKSEDLTLTYDGLNRAANRVAHAILATIGGGQSRVGVLLEQGADIIVAILGVLKSRDVYVPLDPAAPADQLRSIIRDSGARLVVTNTRNAGLAGQLSAAAIQCVNMDEVDPSLSDRDPGVWSLPDDLAMILYTSGSTGKPKGVMHHHRAWLTDLRNLSQVDEVSPNARVGLLGYPAFASAFKEITNTLLNGAALALYDVREKGVTALRSFLIDEGITACHIVASVYRHFTAGLRGAEKFPALRQIRLVGEAVVSEDLDQFKRYFGADCALCIRMGTTEALNMMCCFVDRTTGTGTAGHFLGYPLESAHVSLLAENGLAAGRGEVGQLVVESHHLSYGYWRRPTLTADRFQPSPGRIGWRTYLTGDLARESSSGLYEHRGREDFQTKIRGQRVQPGELEGILIEQPGVEEAAVVAQEDSAGNRLLVAYVVADDRILPSVAVLRARLAAKLPQYMIPQVFMSLGSLPMTATGKVDRTALPRPEEQQLDLQTPYVGPRTPVEEELAGILRQVLGRESVGINDDFFALGGHSLLATQVLSRVHETFNVNVPLRELFAAPTVAGFAERVEMALSEGPSTLAPVARDGDLPLSFAQQRLWFLDQLAPGSWGYHVPYYLRSKGPVRVPVLEACLKEIARRHETLRTTFVAKGGVPFQVIAAESPQLLSQVDMRELNRKAREGLLANLIGEELRRPFDLSRGPLLRVILVRLAADEHVWLMTMHHIVSDGWSMGIFVRELMALYDAFSHGRLSTLPDLPIQYADFSVWQRAWLTGRVRDDQLSYWKAEFEGAPLTLALPTDRPRPALQTFEGEQRRIRFPRELRESLEALSRKQHATLFMTLLAGFQVLLYRYTGQEAFVLGSPIANRNRSEIENLIGFFVNMICLRADLSGDPSFSELLVRVRERAIQAYSNQDLPFEHLVEELGALRDLSHTPVFQSVFSLQSESQAVLALPGLRLTRLRPNQLPAHYDLQLHMRQEPEGLVADVVYNTDLFDAGTIERMLGCYRTLLGGIVANPAERASRLPLLTQEERRELLVEWNDTERQFPMAACMHEVIEQQAARTPDTLALVFEDEQLTYQELNDRANQLARYLRSLGVTADEPVGILLERSVEMIVGLLAVLKAGGAYVPLDPSYPAHRLAFMIADSGMAVLLTQATLQERLGWQRSTVYLEHSALQTHLSNRGSRRRRGTPTILCLDTEWPLVAKEKKDHLTRIGWPDNLAYVLYTSGSSGQPKAVMVEHRQVLNYVGAIQERLGNNPGGSYAMVQPLTVDSCVTVIFPALFSGGSLHLISKDCALDPPALAEYFDRQFIDCLKIAPSHLRALQAGQDLQNLLPRLWLIVGGEPSLQDWMWELQSAAPGVKVFNHYGPTEATVGTLMQQVEEVSGHATSITSLGYPLANTTRYILDRHFEPVGIKIPGQLYLGGKCIARGYQNRADVTAAAFLPHPFTEDAGQRVYHTGDLTRALADGSVAFMGRTDQQVKLRGFRIELGEIRAALARHPGVGENVITTIEDGPTSERLLVAYVVPIGDVSVAALRQHLRAELPGYMIPSVWVFLKSLPRTPHGKLDLNNLPAPDKADRGQGRSFVALRTQTEELLAGIWGEVLGVNPVGMNDNFFVLGGHSLLATQVISRIRAVFRLTVPLRAMFDAPTITSLADWLDKARRNTAPAQEETITSVPREGNLPLSFAQERLWFLNQLEPDSPVYNTPRAMRFRGDLDVAVLERSLNELVCRHENLRTTFRDIDGYPVSVITPPRADLLRLPVVDLKSLPESRREFAVREIAAAEGQRPFDLANGPLLRTSVLVLAELDYVWFCNIHHISTDHWSLAILYRELTALYTAFSHGKPSPLPELPIQYVDFAHWQRQWLQGQVFEEQRAYWKAQLGSIPDELGLPTDRPRPSVRSFRGARCVVVLEETEKLKDLSLLEGATLFMTLLAALQILLYRYTGQTNIPIGTPIANRNQLETEDLIGFFLNNLILNADLSENPTFRELLDQVREVTLGAYAHQDFPFEKLVEELKPERQLNRNPLFQVMLNLQNTPEERLKLGTLVASALYTGSRPAVFDLTLTLAETDQGGIQGWIQYDADIFDHSTVRRMVGHFTTLLKGIVDDPTQRVAHLPILTQEERQQLLVDWHNTSAEYPGEKSIPVWFEEQVERTPEAVAVVFPSTGSAQGGEEQVTYRELNERANQLGHYLHGMGVGPEMLVGIMVERSVEMMVGILGILKANGAYVPLDPTYPREHLRFMVQDAGIAVLLTQSRLAGACSHQAAVISNCDSVDSGSSSAVANKAHCPPLTGSQSVQAAMLQDLIPTVVYLDEQWSTISQNSSANPLHTASGGTLACVMYASGKTRTPKGIGIPHRAISRLVFNTDYVWLGPENWIALVADASFDAATFEIWAALLQGARLVGIHQQVALSPENLGAELGGQGIDTLFLTRALFDQVAGALPNAFAFLENVLLRAEASDPYCVREVLRVGAPQRLLNVYGRTESTTLATWHRVHDLDKDEATVPMGQPIAHTKVRLLDRHGELIPAGVSGELHLGGDGLASGYLNHSDLSAETFVPDAFHQMPGERLYRTGDRARYRADGNIEFLGGIDQQVKSRRFRIEPGEIEAVLGQHPAVRDAVVVAGSGPASRTETEKLLVQIWSKVLGLEQIGVHDNFFDLGGHSLLAIQMISRVRQIFAVALPLRILFERPTIAGLAESFDTMRWIAKGAGGNSQSSDDKDEAIF